MPEIFFNFRPEPDPKSPARLTTLMYPPLTRKHRRRFYFKRILTLVGVDRSLSFPIDVKLPSTLIEPPIKKNDRKVTKVSYPRTNKLHSRCC